MHRRTAKSVNQNFQAKGGIPSDVVDGCAYGQVGVGVLQQLCPLNPDGLKKSTLQFSWYWATRFTLTNGSQSRVAFISGCLRLCPFDSGLIRLWHNPRHVVLPFNFLTTVS